MPIHDTQVASADVARVDVVVAEVDEVDVADAGLAFVFGRRAEPSQPAIARLRALAAKADRFVAVLDSEERVRFFFFSLWPFIWPCVLAPCLSHGSLADPALPQRRARRDYLDRHRP
jgi:hypothetical protein